MNKVDESYPIKQTFSVKKNKSFLSILAIVMFLSVFLNFFNVSMTVIFRIENTSIISLLVYILILSFSFVNVIKYRGITITKVIIYVFFLLIFTIHFMMFRTSRPYLIDQNMALIYIFYLPISIFVVSGIGKWDGFLCIFSKFARYAVILSTIGIILIGFEGQVGYMPFSYSLLPFILILYYSYRQSRKRKDLIIFLVGLIDIIVYGARAPILFVFLFIILYEFILYKRRQFTSKISSLLFYVLIIIVSIPSSKRIFSSLTNIAIKTNSRFLLTLLNGQMAESSGRDLLYESARDVLKNMGWNIYGLFADRILVNQMYVHNIFYELLISFGFIIGSASIILLLYLIIKTTLLNINFRLKVIAILFTIAFFLRYLVSGSFVIEGNFYLYIAILINIYNQRKYTEE